MRVRGKRTRNSRADIVSANRFLKLFEEKLRLIEMRQRNQDAFTIHIHMVHSHPKLITDLNSTLLVLQEP